MLTKRSHLSFLVSILVISFIFSGCTVTLQKGRRSDIEKIDSLNKEIEMLNSRFGSLEHEKSNEIKELEEAKKLLEERLRQEIGDDSIRLEMAEKGLAIIFLTEVLFDSGKDVIKEEAFKALDKISKVLEENVGKRNIGIEGHTDNDPIKYSGWKSNWELSTARATSVLHYLVDEKGIDPTRVSATGYGEYRPVGSNDTEEGRRQNRRVEIVILPKNLEKIQADMQKIVERKREIEKRLEIYKK
ncbi:MAG: OmpA family protein [Candidatus Omnitrophota bacterium]